MVLDHHRHRVDRAIRAHAHALRGGWESALHHDAAHNVRVGHDAGQRSPCSDTISAASARLLASIWHTGMIESAIAASHIGLLGLSSLLTGRASHKLALLDGRRRHRRHRRHRLLGRNNEVLLAPLVGAAHRVLGSRRPTSRPRRCLSRSKRSSASPRFPLRSPGSGPITSTMPTADPFFSSHTGRDKTLVWSCIVAAGPPLFASC